MLETIWDRNAIEGWKGVVEGMVDHHDHVDFSVGCLCHDAEPLFFTTGDAYLLKKGTPVYEVLRKFNVGDTVFVNG